MYTDAKRKKEIINNWFGNIHLQRRVFDEYKHVYLNISTQELKSGGSNSIILVRS